MERNREAGKVRRTEKTSGKGREGKQRVSDEGKVRIGRRKGGKERKAGKGNGVDEGKRR